MNHIDTAASYGDAELRLGAADAGVPDWFFLATKTEERSYAPRERRSGGRSSASR